MESLVLAITLIGMLGVGAQWLAWRLAAPAIVMMAIAGLLAGPVLRILWPSGWTPGGPAPMEMLFGEFFRPMISIAVAVILFEGGLTLNFKEIRGLTAGIRRLVFPGVLFAWAFGGLAAFHIGGLSLGPALLFAGVMVVTGPTVIIPLLRQAKLTQRPAALLKWEGIINDPIGALFAVFVYEAIALGSGAAHGGESVSLGQLVGSLAIASGLAIAFGCLLGSFAATIFHRGWAPEYLKPPILFAIVLVAFEFANLLQDEAGLIAVTAMGVTLANSRIASLEDLRHFKEGIATLLVSGVFIVLTANLTFETIAALRARDFLFVAAMLFVVRPAAIFLSTIGAGLSWRERALVAWIAPRGIVAVAVTSFFGAALVTHYASSGAEAGLLQSAERLTPLAFLMVFATVIAHGFTIGPLSRLLGLSSSERPGVLIVGGSEWSAALGAKLKEMSIPVTIADSSWQSLRPARQASVPVYFGEILSEVTEHHLDFNRFGSLLALSPNESYNALICTDLGPELGRAQVYQLKVVRSGEDDRRGISYALRGRTFLHSGATLDELSHRLLLGWRFQKTRITSEYPPEKYMAEIGKEAEIIMIIRKDALQFASVEAPLRPEIGDITLAFVQKEQAAWPADMTSAAVLAGES
ncbi:MAG: sodium:proton antiporter [Parvularculaceae bacterium]|nr:sodium:proton antiporter [Parvularculaceae bacterium]